MKTQASAPSLTPHQNSLLLLSVAHFLQRKSFSKTLKKFHSEAQIQKNDLTGSSLDLEEMCCKYLSISDPYSSNLNKEQLNDMQGDGNPNSDGQVDIASTLTKKKKKRGNESNVDNIGQSEVDDKSANSKKIEEQVSKEALKESAIDSASGLQSNERAKKEKEKKKKKIKLDESHVDSVEYNGGTDAGIEGKSKDKKKKKNKLTSDSLVEGAAHVSEDTQNAATTTNANDIPLEDKTSKSKKKKKKDDSEDVEKGKSKDDENRISKVDSTVTDDKISKKRKRLDSEVHDTQPVNENAIEDSKRRKMETTEEQLNSLVDGNIEKNRKHSEQKSSKKQQNGSAQPKKPFQRVNVEEVVFVDSRLEDNSYWAKDGAETGYGAKAQEVLGQVKGRGFRHEKTKKKRGSYRGGQIDFNSHSVKFNYSDDE
ncbi:Autoinhibited Ca(2+)-ATPase 10 isoform 1 [Hibiscus syriacus]|uniref:Autoinhibited Ca(2+)-ATPase 10 isoform 1 n=2 Tax=Hibiscus syriacus TaxID=106335 RepID=A0A6A2WV16_HIBSY|nr:Autoinhibited Ca(2+)-ATPase 10 isoform 1 [Hibiscus syriacus]